MPEPLEPFFETLFARDASGSTWLPALLEATPGGRAQLGELVDAPGWLVTPLAVRGASGRLACFEHPSAPPRELLRWFIDHPEQLTWPDGAELSAETDRLRRALLRDDPPGVRERAQDRAREQLAQRTPLSHTWWRFEEPGVLDCVLITGRLVLTIEVDGDAPTTAWYPQRSRRVRALEAARGIAAGRRWASLTLSDGSAPDPPDAGELETAAPHLDADGRRELRDAYLGNLTWEAARAAVSGAVA